MSHLTFCQLSFFLGGRWGGWNQCKGFHRARTQITRIEASLTNTFMDFVRSKNMFYCVKTWPLITIIWEGKNKIISLLFCMHTTYY